jgi:hypothetical protein
MEKRSGMRVSFTARVARLFRKHPDRWINGYRLQKVGGAFAFRTRISDCRRAPYGMTIENRVRRLRRQTVTEYRYVSQPCR